MARPASAYRSDPHFVCARACLAPCGGEIVLYDHGEDAGAARYVVKHQPSGNELRTPSRKKARALYAALAEGRDERGVLPKTEGTREKVEDEAPAASESRPETRPKTLEMPPARPVSGSRVRARARGKTPPPPLEGTVLTMEATSAAFAAAMERAFSDAYVIKWVKVLMNTKRYYQQDGRTIMQPDPTAIEKALRFISDNKLGKPFMRAEVKPSKAVDLSGFTEKLKKSKVFRDTLREMIDEAAAEEAAKEAGP